MKNLVVAVAIAALAFTGCAKEETQVTGPDKRMIRFSTSTIEPQNTRALPVAGTAFEDGDAVGIFATQTINSTTTNLMSNVQLLNTSGAWDYTDHKYFVKGFSYSFVAYAPYDAATTVDAASVNYVVDTDITKQVDFMYAPVVTQNYTGDTTPTAIELNFKHALAQVKFSAQTAKDYSALCKVTVTGIKIAGLESDGSLAFADGAWTLAPAKSADYSQAVNNVVLNSTTAAALTHADSHVLMLLPQALAGKTAVLTVKIESTPANPVVDGQKEITVAIPDVTWAANNIYHYKATLSMDALLGLAEGAFSAPIITSWATETEIPIQ